MKKQVLNFVIFFSMPLALFCQTTHVLIYCDTITNIGDACRKDRKMVSDLLLEVEKHTKMEIKYYNVLGKYTQEETWRQVENLQVDTNDVILFYYTGHGFRYGNQNLQNRKYPYMAFHNNNNEMKLNLQDIHATLKSKGARLTLTFGDLCNSVGARFEPSITTGISFVEIAYKKLFLKAKGDILVASSQPGQTSAATNEGSLFTLCFYEKFLDAVKGKNGGVPEWDKIFAASKVYTANLSAQKQIPIFDINVTYKK